LTIFIIYILFILKTKISWANSVVDLLQFHTKYY